MAHLDAAAVKHLIASIQDLFKDKTCIAVSHHLNNIHWVDRNFVLKEGLLIQEGTHAELVGICGEYRELFEAQIDGTAESA
jgi:ABC-type transport system involved in cytochrome bd biosynthesis fused ATPase/permease subunit